MSGPSFDPDLRGLHTLIYVCARLRGDRCPPPPEWTPAQVAEFERIYATDVGRSAMLNWVLGLSARPGPDGGDAV